MGCPFPPIRATGLTTSTTVMTVVDEADEPVGEVTVRVTVLSPGVGHCTSASQPDASTSLEESPSASASTFASKSHEADATWFKLFGVEYASKVIELPTTVLPFASSEIIGFNSGESSTLIVIRTGLSPPAPPTGVSVLSARTINSSPSNSFGTIQENEAEPSTDCSAAPVIKREPTPPEL